MPTGNLWSGADPAITVEAGSIELASVVQALIPLTLTGIRIYGYSGTAHPGRTAKVWNPLNEALVATIPLPDTLPDGWHVAPCDIDMAAGDTLYVSYTADGGYAAVPNAFTGERRSADNAMRFPAGPGNGRFTGAGGFPGNFTATSPFYGVDVEYTWTGTPPPEPEPEPGDKLANSELAGVAWLNWLPGLDAPASTSRPADADSWAGTGFVVVSTVGDSAGPDSAGWNAPILSVDVWTYTRGSGKPQTAWAAGIAQIIRQAAKDGRVPPGTLPTKAGYERVEIQTVWPVGEARRVPEPDGSSFAHYTLDIGVGWVRVPS